jgi:hypothetical protein
VRFAKDVGKTFAEVMKSLLIGAGVLVGVLLPIGIIMFAVSIISTGWIAMTIAMILGIIWIALVVSVITEVSKRMDH